MLRCSPSQGHRYGKSKPLIGKVAIFFGTLNRCVRATIRKIDRGKGSKKVVCQFWCLLSLGEGLYFLYLNHFNFAL